MNFNLSSGEPVAIYKTSNNDKKLIYLNDEKQQSNNNNNLTDNDIQNIIEEFINNNKGRLSMRQINEIYEALKNNIPPSNNKLKDLYNELKKTDNKNKSITINNNSMFPVFNPNQDRKVYYIAGMSGCGKSTFTSDVIQQYTKLYKNNNIYLFSNKPKDEVLDKHKKLIRIELNEELTDEPLTLDELKNSLVIFDDVEYTPNKQISEELDRIRDMILQQGRSYHISFVYISHQLTNYKHSRIILNECHSCVLFPKLTTSYALKYLLDKYFGFTKNEILKLKTLNTRWVCINKVPPYVIHQNGIYNVDC